MDGAILHKHANDSQRECAAEHATNAGAWLDEYVCAASLQKVLDSLSETGLGVQVDADKDNKGTDKGCCDDNEESFKEEHEQSANNATADNEDSASPVGLDHTIVSPSQEPDGCHVTQ